MRNKWQNYCKSLSMSFRLLYCIEDDASFSCSFFPLTKSWAFFNSCFSLIIKKYITLFFLWSMIFIKSKLWFSNLSESYTRFFKKNRSQQCSMTLLQLRKAKLSMRPLWDHLLVIADMINLLYWKSRQQIG